MDEITHKGGDVCRMGVAEYLSYLDSLPARIKRQVNDDWGEFPGEGMALREEVREPVLLVTGVKSGKAHVMVQPKRGWSDGVQLKLPGKGYRYATDAITC